MTCCIGIVGVLFTVLDGKQMQLRIVSMLKEKMEKVEVCLISNRHLVVLSHLVEYPY